MNGDFDGDTDVDGNDFLVWQRGGSPNGATASDLTLWEANFDTASFAVAAAGVPEPNTLVLFFFGAISLLSRYGSARRTKEMVIQV